MKGQHFKDAYENNQTKTRDEGAPVIKELIIITGKESNMSRLCQFLLKNKRN
jgi:hypothetical protein